MHIDAVAVGVRRRSRINIDEVVDSDSGGSRMNVFH
jgi:hypothetical protein